MKSAEKTPEEIFKEEQEQLLAEIKKRAHKKITKSKPDINFKLSKR